MIPNKYMLFVLSLQLFLIVFELFLCARHSLAKFFKIISFNPHNNILEEIEVTVGNFTEVTQLESGKVGI